MKNSILVLLITLISTHSFSAVDGNSNENELTITCQDIVVSLDQEGYFSISPEDIIASSDGTIAFYEMSHEFLDCSQMGVVPVSIIAFDEQQNASECTAMVTVEDVLSPVVICSDMTIMLDGNGNAVTSAQELATGYDNCSIDAFTADRTEFSGADVGYNTVTITAQDMNGNTSNCSSLVEVMDEQPPFAYCQDVTVSLDVTGTASVTEDMIDNGSFDNSDQLFIELDQSVFDCGNFGNNLVTMTVTDASGNTSTCNAAVSVVDNIAPIAVCADLNITLDLNGEASITTNEIDNGSNDNCNISYMSLSQESFGPADIGDNTVELTLFDTWKNIATCTSNVHVSVPANNPLVIQAAFTMPSEDELDGPIGQDEIGGKANEMEMSLYPNPVRNTATTVVLRNMPKGTKEINVIVYDQNGVAIMYEKRLEIQSDMKLKLDNFQPFQPGIYMIYVDVDGKVLSQQLVVG